MTSHALSSPVPAALAELVPPDTLAEARARRDALTCLLGREREAAADFLRALADFDRRRGWERLGHASLFAFLTRELGLSKGAAFLRLTAARLLPRHPAVEAALRSGRLCLSAVGELARVLSEENEAEVLPRFLGCSAREAREVVAALRPVPSPPVRDVVTRIAPAPATRPSVPLTLAAPEPPPTSAPAAPPAPSPALPIPVLTSEPTQTHPARERPATSEPLTADLRRLHLTVSRAFLEKVDAARTGLSHAHPGATMEQVLDAALDLLLERQARRKRLVKRLRPAPEAASTAPSPPTPESAHPERSAGEAGAESRETPTSPPGTRRRPATPAVVEREVRLRDGDRCQHPLDAGGICGSTWQVQLDHVVPLALGGPTTADNLRCLCSTHHRSASEAALGPLALSRRPR